jgi:hypothetical protein
MYNSKQKAWRNHPCFKMWEGYDSALIEYGIAICSEWKRRGYKDTMLDKFMHIFIYSPLKKTIYPWWYGNEEFHSRYRSILLYKNYDWYSQFGWKEEPAVPLKINKNGTVTLPYMWNSKNK